MIVIIYQSSCDAGCLESIVGNILKSPQVFEGDGSRNSDKKQAEIIPFTGIKIAMIDTPNGFSFLSGLPYLFLSFVNVMGRKLEVQKIFPILVVTVIVEKSYQIGAGFIYPLS